MFFGGCRGITSILSGKSNGRSVHDELQDGRITISGVTNGKSFKRMVQVENGEVWDNKLIVNGKTVHHIMYGCFEKKGSEIVRFKKGTGTGKHGKARRYEKIFGHDGVCHSWYNNGRLVRQKFIYDNNTTAYNYNAFRNDCTVKDYDGNILYEIKGNLNGQMNAYHGGHSVFLKSMPDWFILSKPFEVKKKGKVIYAGQVSNHQRVGKWVEDGKQCYYVHGVPIPEKLYNTPPDKLDPLKILKLPNAQTRMALMEKIGTERIAKVGKVIHKDGSMRLYDIPQYDVRLLRVQCTTTKSFYYLRVPKDSKKCEEARQWTFHVGDKFSQPIKFAIET